MSVGVTAVTVTLLKTTVPTLSIGNFSSARDDKFMSKNGRRMNIPKGAARPVLGKRAGPAAPLRIGIVLIYSSESSTTNGKALPLLANRESQTGVFTLCLPSSAAFRL